MAAPGVDFKVNFSKELQRVSAKIAATPKQLEKAGQRAIKKTMRWMYSRAAREISQLTGIPQKALKFRFSLKTVGKGAEAVTILWIGISPVLAEKAGKARQTKKGVSLKKHRYEGAFVADMYGYDSAVWIRASRNHSQYTTTGKARKANPNSLPAHLRGRFPVQHIAIDIADPATQALKRLESRVPDEFRKKLDQELNYVVNHERA
ncbi:TPA: phage tail protein [Vibrio parahaemolyticus]|nr:phage tail protein [Vibrio vulnificus]MDF5667831.1 phage tail protein [Vibrio parahaemolyticus]MDW1970999.1 phage tail protein [Vibrio sp. 945]HCE4999826.1 phage tail protein [Vibrio parahaemolyticus]